MSRKTSDPSSVFPDSGIHYYSTTESLEAIMAGLDLEKMIVY